MHGKGVLVSFLSNEVNIEQFSIAAIASPGDMGLPATHGMEEMHGRSFCSDIGDFELELEYKHTFEFGRGCDIDFRATGLLRHTWRFLLGRGKLSEESDVHASGRGCATGAAAGQAAAFAGSMLCCVPPAMGHWRWR